MRCTMNPLDLKAIELTDGTAPSFAWPGGYPLFYLCEDNGVLCPACVNKDRKLIDKAKEDDDKQWNVVACDVNWEDESMHCDNCSKRIPSAYGDDE